MPQSSDQIRTFLGEPEFQKKWQQIETWLRTYFIQFPILSEYFYKWIDLAFANGPTVYEQFIDYISGFFFRLAEDHLIRN